MKKPIREIKKGTEIGVKLQDERNTIARFADNVVILSENKQDLKNCCSKWLEYYELNKR